MLVHIGSSVDIIFQNALDQLLIELSKIILCDTGDIVILKGIISMSIILSKVLHYIIHMIDFLIMDHPSTYNNIIITLTKN